MGVHYRPMRPKDVRECAEIVATHPTVGPRYGDTISQLRPAWLRLIGSEAFRNVVLEETDGFRTRMLGIGASVFVSNHFLQALKTPPLLWIGPELTRRVMRGDSPVLSDKEVRIANSVGGLNLVVWEACIRREEVHRPDVYHASVASFVQYHRGFLIRELIGQVTSVKHLQVIANNGGFFLNTAEGRYMRSPVESPAELVVTPHIWGSTRELLIGRLGSWVSCLFDYKLPQLGFSASEQRLLLCALDGGTDEQLADQLAISLSGVKKAWSSIYQRVAERLPELIPHDSAAEGERGKEKKQLLVTYLRDHLEELRPVSRKLLQQKIAAQGKPASAA
jgi:hypothetical protein